ISLAVARFPPGMAHSPTPTHDVCACTAAATKSNAAPSAAMRRAARSIGEAYSRTRRLYRTRRSALLSARQRGDDVGGQGLRSRAFQ
ncbi:MAG TPA: hypothetical protein VMH26_20735, partial [Burkholderiales bacterium]|nr:hypothetical protein [Burkholderiales bacterium]